MPRKAYLAPHLTADQLRARYRQTAEPVEARRWHLLWLVSQGWTIKHAAQTVGCCYDYAKDLVHAYNERGTDALPNRRRTRANGWGRKPLLDADQQQQLRQALLGPAPDGGLWSGPKVAQWIAQVTGRPTVSPQRGWDWLKRLGFSLKTPRPTHAKADPEAQIAFKKT